MRNSLRSWRGVVAAAVLLAVPFGSALGQATPEPVAKKTLRAMQPFHASRQVILKFVEGRKIRLSAQGLTGLTSLEASGLASALRTANVSIDAVRRMTAQPEGELEQKQATAVRLGRALSDANLYFVIDLPAGVDAAVLANRLNALSVVEFAEPAPRPSPLT